MQKIVCTQDTAGETVEDGTYHDTPSCTARVQKGGIKKFIKIWDCALKSVGIFDAGLIFFDKSKFDK